MEYFVIWHNYDGNHIEKFKEDQVEAAEECIVGLIQKMSRDEYGTDIDCVIYGKEVEFKVVETAKKVVLKK